MSTDINERKYKVQNMDPQLDESTDVSNCAQLLVYVRYVSNDVIRSELLLSKDMKTTTTGKDVFELVAIFFKENNLPMDLASRMHNWRRSCYAWQEIQVSSFG